MKDVNKIILLGRLGADPVQRETKNGVPVVHFPLATSRRTRDEEGVTSAEGETAAFKEETQWHRVVAWGKTGETCAQYLKKGNPVFIEGSLRSHKYEGKDGTSRMSFEVHAENVSFLGGSRSAARASQEAPAQASA